METNTVCNAVTDWYEDQDGVGPEGGTGEDNDIILNTNYNLSCGSLSIGESRFAYRNGGGGGLCGTIPVSYLSGAGAVYEIQLTLTPDCDNNVIPSDLPAYNSLPAANISTFGPSENPLTPSEGIFTSNHFQLYFNTCGSTNVGFGVYASTNLQNWEFLESLPATTNTQESFTDYYASNFTQRYYIIESNQVACSGAYGFVKVTAPAGLSMIANPLMTTNMIIGALLTNVPNATTLQFWGTTNWGPKATFSSGSWDNPDWPLLPGDGALIDVSTTTTITFVGQVLDGLITNMIPSGLSVRSSAIPLETNIDALGLTGLASGDYILEWNGTGYTGYTNVSGAWQPSTPTLAAGQSFVVYSSAGTSWGMDYTAADVYALSQPVIISVTATNDAAGDHGLGYSVSINWERTGWGALRDRANAVAPPGAMYELQEIDGGFIDNDVFTSVTDQSLIPLGQPINFPIIYPSGGPDYLRLRYINGNICGPWSDPVENDPIIE